MAGNDKLQVDMVVDAALSSAQQKLQDLYRELERVAKAAKTPQDAYERQQLTLSKIKRVQSDILTLEKSRAKNLSATQKQYESELKALTTRSKMLKREQDLAISKQRIQQTTNAEQQKELILRKKKAQAEQSFIKHYIAGSDTQIRRFATIRANLEKQNTALKEEGQLRTQNNARIEQAATRVRAVWVEEDRGLKRAEAARQRIQRHKDNEIKQNERLLAQERQKAAALAGTAAHQEKAQINRNISQATRFGDGGALMFATIGQIFGQYTLLSGALSALSFSTSFIVDLDREFTQLQAITASTNLEMDTLKDRLIEVSEATKFTAVEVAQAATILGQAGFSVKEIDESIQSVTFLATAVGADLKTAADVVTSSLSVFRLQASETANVANVLTGAINNSKLTIDKLALGIQFASNIAFQSGLQFEELVATLGGLANAGIRSGSTIGTGVRQLLIDIQTPTAKFERQLKNVGLTLDDVDIKTNTFVGVLKNLKQSGFGSAEALESFEVRAAAAFTAVSNQLDSVVDLQTQLSLTSAATEAANIQMKSLSNTGARFQSVFGTVVERIFAPLRDLFRDSLSVMIEFGSALNGVFGDSSVVLTGVQVFASVLTGLIAGKVLIWIGSLVKGLWGLNAASGASTVSLRHTGAAALISASSLLGTSRAAQAAAVSYAGLSVASRGLMTIFGGWIGILSAAGFGLYSLWNSTEETVDKVEELTTSLSENKDEAASLTQTITGLSDEINALLRRGQLDAKDTQLEILRLSQRFEGLAAAVAEAGESYEGLLTAQRKLREEKRAELKETLKLQLADSQALEAELRQQQLKPIQDLLRSQQTDRKFFGNIQDRLGSTNINFSDITSRVRSAQTGNLSNAGLIRFKNEAVALQDAAGNNSLNLNGSMRDALNRLADQLLKISETGLKISSENNSQTTLQSGIGVLDNQQSKAFRDRELQLERFTRQFNTANSNFRRDDAGGLFGPSQAFGSFNETVRPIFDQLVAFEEELEELGDPNTYSELFSAVGTLKAKFRRTLADVAQKNYDFLELAIDVSTAENKKNVERAKKQASNSSSLKEFEKLLEETRSASLEIMEDQLKLFEAHEDNRLENKTPQEVEVIQQRISNERSRLYNQILKDVESIVRNYASVRDKELDLKFQPLENNLTRRQIAANDRVSRANTLTNIARADRNTSNVSDGRLYAIEQEQLHAVIRAEREALIIAQQRQQLEIERRDIIAQTLADNIRQRDHLVQQKGDKIQIQELDRKIAADRAAVQKHDEAVARADREILEIRTQIQERTETLEPLSVGEEVQNAIELWKQTSGVFDSVSKTIGNGLGNVLAETSNGFRDMFANIISGSQSAGDAFKSFAGAVVDSIIQMVATLIANKIILTILGAFGGLGAPGTGLSGLQGISGTGAPPVPFSQGGLVKGTVQNRDSVHAILQPDEFVIKKSAVDAVGVDFLRQLNAQGASAAVPKGEIKPMRGGGGTAQTNVYVVSQEQKPIPGPNEVIAWVNDDIHNGGTTKKLIKQVNQGL